MIASRTAKRQITTTAPNGQTITTSGLGKTRKVGAIRITMFSDTDILVTVHATLNNAITGANQSPEWNNLTRWAIEVDENDQVTGEWIGATK